ncbi:MAG: hypothetical protein E3J86_03160 [Candidatus Thorarchaeota archaeon]|nr:MAG: hypothetical protein E3J86_03160 [Candidatus Thorarchaeota archaeon]
MKSGSQGRFFEDKAVERMEVLGHKVLGIDRRPGHNLARGGWPDIISVKGTEVHVWEVKSGKEHEVHDHQREVLQTLRRLGAIVHIIRYTDADSEPEEEILSTLADWVSDVSLRICVLSPSTDPLSILFFPEMKHTRLTHS